MRLQSFPYSALRLVQRRAAPLAALLLGATLLASPRGAAAQDARDFRIQNQSGATIVELYVSPVSDPNWGPNILRGAIPPGQAARVVFPSGDRFFTCNYDVEVVTNDGQTRAATNMDLCSGEFLFYPSNFDRAASGRQSGSGPQAVPIQPAVTVPQAATVPQPAPVPQPVVAQGPRSVTIENSTRFAILNVQVATARQQDWGPNMLTRAIMPGETANVPFTFSGSNSCLFDVRAIDSDGFVNEDFDINVCQPQTLVFR
jgi:hypothetical protein